MILQGKVSLISADGITQLHIFIFVLAAFHVLSCIITLTLSRAKVFKVKSLFLLRLLFGARIQFFVTVLGLQMRKWKKWEIETATSDYQFSHGRYSPLISKWHGHINGEHGRDFFENFPFRIASFLIVLAIALALACCVASTREFLTVETNKWEVSEKSLFYYVIYI